ncbi:GntR family transcriptional regulator [Pararhodobacter zhoushanensis]|uniref:GntR family transcriptional regulator n=1 Tax=Pararhodobacter zhoushanensis TaxID=2479545 RepID=A0ABT3GWM2_9RHOB|nr:GntR family transcriptional regulator [Pararhodobacter zhoushanensis]MCW1931928.1 GntR family transcriptional regulator [Pararhodobacter zhoushanensis]
MNADAPSGPEALVRDVLQGLAEGRFVPGQRLAEPDLMARYGMGRSTVREGLGRLAASGIVVQAPHRGAQIRLLSRRAAQDVLRVTDLLLGLAARQAAEAVAAGADPAPLIAAAHDYDAAEPGDRARVRARYYRALTTLAGNAELDRLLPLLQVHLIRAQLRLNRPPGRGARTALVAAVAAGQPETAELAARSHIRALVAALPDLPDSAFAPD